MVRLQFKDKSPTYALTEIISGKPWAARNTLHFFQLCPHLPWSKVCKFICHSSCKVKLHTCPCQYTCSCQFHPARLGYTHAPANYTPLPSIHPANKVKRHRLLPIIKPFYTQCKQFFFGLKC